jgi:hypothetical protein
VSVLPRFSRKEARELAAELDEAGFTYVDDDSKGHACFVHADSGYSVSLSETPGHGQIQRVRRIIANATGRRPEKFNRARQRERQAALRDVTRRDAEMRARLVAAAEARRTGEIWREEVRLKLDARWRELRSLDRMMRSVPGVPPGRSAL